MVIAMNPKPTDRLSGIAIDIRLRSPLPQAFGDDAPSSNFPTRGG